MKEKLTDQLRDIFANGQRWLKLEIEYAKLTATEKCAILMSALVAGAICMVLALIVLTLLSFCLVEAFCLILSPVLAYLCVAGIYLVIMAVVFLLRKPLIGNPIAKFITRVLIGSKKED